MATTTSNFPTDIDTFAPITAGPSGTRMNDSSEPASAIITHIQAALTAIQNVLGTDDGAVANSVLRRLLLLSAADTPFAVDTITGTSKTLTLTDRGVWQDWTATGAKTLTVDTAVGADAGEYRICNAAASGDLTIVASGVAIRSPSGGSVVLAPGQWCELVRVATNVLQVFAIASSGAGASTAAELSYDNATSGLASTDVQGAIDELNTVAGALANIRGTAWRSFDWANTTFYTRTAFNGGFNTLNSNTRYAAIECHPTTANSGGYISGVSSTPVGNIAVLGPWANNWTGIMVFIPYQGANDVSTTAGLQDSSSGTATSSLFGVEYSLANGWEIVFRYSSTDLQARVPFTMTAAENMILEVYYETDAAQTAVELVRVTVRDYPSGSVIATDTWTGSTVFNNLYWRLKSYKVGVSSLREFLYSVLYIGDGFNPPPSLSFG